MEASCQRRDRQTVGKEGRLEGGGGGGAWLICGGHHSLLLEASMPEFPLRGAHDLHILLCGTPHLLLPKHLTHFPHQHRDNTATPTHHKSAEGMQTGLTLSGHVGHKDRDKLTGERGEE